MTFAMARATQAAPPSILLVDDEVDVLPEYQDFLELEGFTALTCCNPEKAAEQVLAEPSVALVITDLRMAKLDGVSLIRQLRAMLPAERSLAFIILTGDAAYQIGTDLADIPVLIKPADTDALMRAVKAALARST